MKCINEECVHYKKDEQSECPIFGKLIKCCRYSKEERKFLMTVRDLKDILDKQSDDMEVYVETLYPNTSEVLLHIGDSSNKVRFVEPNFN